MTDVPWGRDQTDGPGVPNHDPAVAKDNERTFRTWLHTGIGLMVLGVAAVGLTSKPTMGLPIVGIFTLLVAVSGMVLIVIGRHRYARNHEWIAEGQFVPADRAIAVATALAVLIGLASLLIVWLFGAAP